MERRVTKKRFFEILDTVNTRVVDFGDPSQFHIQVGYVYAMFCKTYNDKDKSYKDRTAVYVKLGTFIYLIEDIENEKDLIMFIANVNEYVGNITVEFIDWSIV